MGPSDHRLAAVVFVDVVSFSRMMAEDEEGTLATLRAHRNVTDPVVLNHGGRIVKGTGDGLLIEFAGERRSARDLTSTDAFDLYLRGQHELNKHSVEGFLGGIGFLDKAHELAPDFVAPVVAVAPGCSWPSTAGGTMPSIRGHAGIAAAKDAYRLDSADTERCP
jgi:class 3 adenylate cyclase